MVEAHHRRTVQSANLFGLLTSTAYLAHAHSPGATVVGLTLVAVNAAFAPRWWATPSGGHGDLTTQSKASEVRDGTKS